MTQTDITRTIHGLLFTPSLDLAEALDRHFAPDYRQRSDGMRPDRTSRALATTGAHMTGRQRTFGGRATRRRVRCVV